MPLSTDIFGRLDWLTKRVKNIYGLIGSINQTTAQAAIDNPPYFEVVWHDASAIWNTLSDANTDMSANFTSMITLGNTQRFYGGSDITLTIGHNLTVAYNEILSINDIGGVVTSTGADFSGLIHLQYINLPKAELFGTKNFRYCADLRYVNLPSTTNIGTECFNSCTSLETLNINKCGTMGAFPVFDSVTGLTITVTLPAVLVTDPNIVSLQTNNTVTLIIV